MRRTERRRVGSGSLLWGVVIALSASSVWAQQDFNTIPGTGTALQPRVFIIFDTSNSMRDLPQTQQVPTYVRAPDPVGADGGTRALAQYFFDDWDPGSTVDCNNRFCVGKRVLYNVLPPYADSVELGLAGYYQFRTRYLGTGDMRCVYDVLSGPNVSVPLPMTTSSMMAPSVPAALASCGGPAGLHTYTYNSTGTFPGTPVTCNYHFDYGASRAPGAPLNTIAGLTTIAGSSIFGNDSTVCNALPVSGSLTRQMPVNVFNGMGPMGNSRIYIRMNRGTTTCPATVQFAGRTGSGTGGSDLLSISVTNGTVNTAASLGATPALPVSSTVSSVSPSATAIRTTNIGAGQGLTVTCTQSNPCTLTRDTDGGAPIDFDTATTTTTVFGGADAGATEPVTSIVFGGLTHTRTGGPFNNDFTYDRTAGNATCDRPDGGVASTSDVYFVPSGNLSSVFPGANYDCSSLGQGCRVTFNGAGMAATAGTLSGAPAATICQPPSGMTVGTCSLPCGGGTSSVSYSYTLAGSTSFNINRKVGASCSSLTNSGWDGLSFPPEFQTPAFLCGGATSCTAANRCSITASNGSTSTRTSDDPTTLNVYEDVTSADGGTFDVNQTSFGATCPATATSTTASGCSVGSPCIGTRIGGTSPQDGGTAPTPILTFGNTPTSFTSAGSPYTLQGPTGVTQAATEPTGLGVGCSIAGGSGTYSKTSGTVGGVSCTASQPCIGRNPVPMCGSVPCSSDTVAAANGCQLTYDQYRYVAPTYGVCRYQRTRYTFTLQTCTLTIPQYNRNTPACSGTCPTCTYRVRSWTYSTPNAYPYCRYYATRFPYTGVTPTNYGWEWRTKGGEYVGSVEHNPSQSVNYCGQPGSSYASYQSSCPTEISETVNSSHPLASSTCRNGRKCLLRWRNSNVTGYAGGRMAYANAANRFDAGYQLYNPASPRCLAPDRDGGEVVMPDVTTYPANASTSLTYDQFMTTNSYDYCRPVSGTVANEVRLRADWYDPSLTNVESQLPANLQSNRDANKNWGLSRGTIPSQNFVPIAASNMAPIQQALSKCVLPEADAGLNTPPQGGLCMAETGLSGVGRSCGGGECQNTSLTGGRHDFTPLVGSLRNAREYLESLAVSDNQCRKYFVLLLTDGLEDTPANFTQVDIRNAVTDLRNVNAGSFLPASERGVRTFVIGFGAGLATAATDGGAISDLDVIARAGGRAIVSGASGIEFDNVNGRALSAASQTELESTLSIVFNDITGGAFSRSRPTLTSDGSRLYHAYFERGLGPEWRGNLIAYDLPTTVGGSLAEVWQHRPIVDAVAAGSRDLVAFMPVMGTMTTQSFSTSNTTLVSYLDAVGVPGGQGAAAVAFARNDSLNEPFAPTGGPRRSRNGAFVHSSAVAVGRSPFGDNYGGQGSETSRAGYTAFRASTASRPTRIVIGGNDGIWRGVADRDAGTVPNGNEAWGIVPGPDVLAMIPTTRNRAIPTVDGTTAVSEVCWPSSGTNAADCTATDWRTIAVVALRQGGESLTAVQMQSDGSRPSYLWTFNDQQSFEGTPDQLALTYSTPIFGRVEVGGIKRWVGFVGGGQAETNTVNSEGDSFYILDAQTGRPYVGGTGPADFTKFNNLNGGGCIGARCPSIAGRPATWRRENATDTDSVYIGSTAGCSGGGCALSIGGKLFAARTRATNNPNTGWRPRTWWDPRSSADAVRVDGQQAPLFTMDKTTGAQVDSGCRLPLGSGGAGCTQYDRFVSFYNRPRLAAISDNQTINARPDVFIGTGNINDLTRNILQPQQNFFFAIHDREFGNPSNDPTNGGEIMWAYAFDPHELVTGEPAIVSGSVIVPTFIPPEPGGQCVQFGDSFLYAFDPVTGAPRRVLQDPANPGQYRSVVRLTEVGALSDLVVSNGRVYYATTRGGIGSNTPLQTGLGGKVQGWRRVR